MKDKITLATLPNATAQEVFDQVADHLLTQNEKSMDEDGCVYKNPNGLKCAAGCFISDEEFEKEIKYSFNGCSWSTLVSSGIISDNHSELIRQLQGVHDNYTPNVWKTKLIRLADKFNLDYSIVTNHANIQSSTKREQ